MTQTERIRRMEDALDRSAQAVRRLDAALDAYLALSREISELEAYYTGPLWRQDYEDDEAGRLPDGLCRGVLSEDAVYDLLRANAALTEKMAAAAQRAKREPSP